MCFISSFFMLFYNLGKTRNLEPTLGHNEERKKQLLLPNCEYATILKNTIIYDESAHELPGALRGKQKSESSLTPKIFDNCWCHFLHNQTSYTTLSPWPLAHQVIFRVPEFAGGRGRPRPRSSNSQPGALSNTLLPDIWRPLLPGCFLRARVSSECFT